MQAAGQLAQLGERLLELVRGAAQQRHRRVRVAEALLEHPQLHGERDEPLLRAVVEVALQPPALGARPASRMRTRDALSSARASALSSASATSSAKPASRCSASGPSAPTDATSTSPHVRPPATTGAATAER